MALRESRPRLARQARLAEPRSGESAALLCTGGLHRRARYRTVRTENAARTWFWPEPPAASSALVHDYAGVGWHRLAPRGAAGRTGERRFDGHRMLHALRPRAIRRV